MTTEEIRNTAEQKMHRSIEAFKTERTKIRTGAWGSGALRATPIATEDFDYTVGGAAPMDGGSGWGEPWKDSGGTVNAALTLAAGSLNPLGQLAVGNRLSPSGSTFFRKLSTAAAAAVAAEGTANGEVWVSFTAQQTTAASGTGGMALWNAGSTTFTDSSNNYSLMLVRNTWDGGDWSWTDVTTVGAGSLGTVPVTTAVRYVMRLDFQATQTAATMYVFTSSSQIGADIASSTPATTVSGNITNASGNRPVFDRIRLSGNNGLVFDSVRIATTFAEVMPVAATPPTITVPPTPATASEFDRHTFSVTAAGSTPLSFQWKKGSQTLDGQTSSILTLDNLGFSDAGSYSVTVTNAYGSAESDPVNLTVTTYPRDLTASAALIARLLPNQADHFVVEFVAPSNGLDVYEVEGLGEKVVLRGNTSVPYNK